MTILKIKLKLHDKACYPEIRDNGDWIDLKTAEEVIIPPMKDGVINSGKISLGVSMELPFGYEAIIAPRSSTFFKYSILNPGSIGVIDGSYKGDDDIWHFPYIALNNKEVVIPKGTRICQFRIFQNQFFDYSEEGFRFVEVDSLNNKKRGGFGSSGD